MKKLILILFIILINLIFSSMCFAEENFINVSTCEQLINYINNDSSQTICLNNDIKLNQNLIITKSITLNLNNHSIIIPKNCFISCGKKEPINNNEKIQSGTKSSWFCSLFKKEPKNNIYKYYDNICITLKNGLIKKDNGENGLDILNSKNMLAKRPKSINHGQIACPDFSITAISGTLNIKNITISGGNGGNGGNGTCTKEIHFLLSGSGSNGGNGGNGINIFHSDMGKIYITDSNLIPGLGGNGGSGGEPNPNYWLWSGLKGSNGKDGKNGIIINDFSKLYYR